MRSASLLSQRVPERNLRWGSRALPFLVFTLWILMSRRRASRGVPEMEIFSGPRDSISTRKGEPPGNTRVRTFSPLARDWLRMKRAAAKRSRMGEILTCFHLPGLESGEIHSRRLMSVPFLPSIRVERLRVAYFSSCSEWIVWRPSRAEQALSVASSW